MEHGNGNGRRAFIRITSDPRGKRCSKPENPVLTESWGWVIRNTSDRPHTAPGGLDTAALLKRGDSSSGSEERESSSGSEDGKRESSSSTTPSGQDYYSNASTAPEGTVHDPSTVSNNCWWRACFCG